MTDRYDVIVLGVGAIGSAATYHLSLRGREVLGLERHGIPHAMGSSHGISRLHSLSSSRGGEYVRIARRAYELWEALSAATGEELFHRTGHVRAWPADGDGHRGGIDDAIDALEENGLEYERLTGAAVNDRWPGYSLPDDHEVCYQPDSGFLDPEFTVSTHVRQAARHGAEVRAHERVVDWRADDDGVRVRTEKGAYEADELVVTAGAWAATFVEELVGVAVPERRVMAWLQPTDPDRFLPENFPTFSVDIAEGYHYGAPTYRVPGFKVGNRPRVREVIDPDTMSREVTAAEEELLRAFAGRYFPAGAGPTARLTACIVTMTPGERFVVDRHPDHDNVTFTGGFSGSGFHVSSAVGELLADLTTGEEPAVDPAAFALGDG